MAHWHLVASYMPVRRAVLASPAKLVVILRPVHATMSVSHGLLGGLI